MDIVVKGRNVEVPEHFRQHVSDKLAPSERLDSRVIRLDVELSHEKNPRQSAKCQRVEITVQSKGPVIRAEACAESFYVALDAAVLKLEARLRKAHDRRRVHHGAKTPASVAQATAALPLDLPAAVGELPVALLERPSRDGEGPDGSGMDGARLDGAGLDGAGTAGTADGPDATSDDAASDDTALLVVRDKTHAAQPLSTEEALHEMELVGHDFYLFVDAGTGQPSVVYRRHGYDYGVIRLATS